MAIWLVLFSFIFGQVETSLDVLDPTYPVTRFIAPTTETQQTLRVEIKTYIESDKGIEEVQLTILPYQSDIADPPLVFDPAGERIMMIYLNPFDRRGYDTLPLIPTLNNDFTAIGLHGWSWHRYPDQFDDPVVLQAIADIKAKGFKFVLGRDMWPRWISHADKAANPILASRAMAFDDKWIRDELEGINADKKKYGAWGTYIDMEPYGQRRTVDDGSLVAFEGSLHTLKAHIREHGWELGLSMDERRVYAEALKRVRKATGLSIDFVYPSSAGRAESYAWACREIGEYASVASCFYLTDITDDVQMSSSSGYPTTIPIWYSAVTNPPEMWGASFTLSPDQVRQLWSQFEQGKQLHPELKGFMVFSGALYTDGPGSPTKQKLVLEAFQQPPG